MVNITKAFVAKIEKAPLEVLKSLTIEEIVSIIQKANHQYYNTAKPIFTDQIFDLIKAHLEELEPNHPALKFVGSKVKQGVKSVLPYYMGSLDKIKSDEKVFIAWKKRYEGTYVVSDKLDGNSGLLYYQPNKELKLYTRGNGKEGQDISHILPFLKNSINLDMFQHDVAIRGELVISKEDFEKMPNRGANARNTVAGLLNAVIPDLAVAKVTSFVAYEVIEPIMIPSAQMKFIHSANIACVYNKPWKYDELSLENLSLELVQRRKKSPYEIDGIVIVHDDLHPRTTENPEYAFAFKSVLTMDKAEVIVNKIEWNMSKDGVFVPVVHFTPVQLDGVIITKAHGFNAKYIKDNSLGPGAVIVVMRSGAVIPYIVETLVPAPNVDFPDVKYKWTKSMVDIVLENQQNNEELKLRNIEYFFEKINVKGLNTGIVKKLFKAGFATVGDILHIKSDDLLKVEGFQNVLASKLHEAIQERKKTLDIHLIMDASNVLGRGFGYKKIKLICTAYPRIIQQQYIPSVQELTALKGVEKGTATQFINNLPAFFKFMKDNKIHIEVNDTHHKSSATTYGSEYVNGKTFVFSGVRDKELEQFIDDNGGKVVTSVTKNTSMVIVKSVDVQTAKTAKAKTLNIPVMNIDDLRTEIEK